MVRRNQARLSFHLVLLAACSPAATKCQWVSRAEEDLVQEVQKNAEPNEPGTESLDLSSNGESEVASDEALDLGASQCQAISHSPALRPLHSDGVFIRDDEGRIVFLRGVNMSGAEGGNKQAFKKEDFEALRVFAFNAVRLPFGWVGIEPEMGQIDETYLAFLDSMLEWAEQESLYVVLDAHQWYWSLVGMPKWTCPLEPKVDQDYLMTCGGIFFSAEDLVNRFAEMWRMLSKRYRDRHVIAAFDILNEPPPPSLSAILDGSFEGNTLPVFYTRVADAIRSEDPLRMLFIEPAIVSFGNTVLPPMPFANAVYSPHIYIPHTYQEGVGLTWLFEPSPDFLQAQYEAALKDAKRLGMPIVVGEFGVVPEKEGAAGWLLTSLSLQDRFLIGSFYWDYQGTFGLFDSNKQPKAFFLEHALKPYLAASAGDPIEVVAEPWSGFFRARIRISPQYLCKVSEVSLPQKLYPSGPVVTVTPNARFEYDPAHQRLYIQNLEPDGIVEIVVQ